MELHPKKPVLERISHSQMQALVLLEAWNVVESALTRIVWQMQTDSPIHSNHKHSHIIADTHSGAYSQLLVELIKLEGLEEEKSASFIQTLPASRNRAP